MPHTQIDTATIAGTTVTVQGPLTLTADEQAVKFHFMIVQDGVTVRGEADPPPPGGNWSGTAPFDPAHPLTQGQAQAAGILIVVGQGKDVPPPPAFQAFFWAEEIQLT